MELNFCLICASTCQQPQPMMSGDVKVNLERMEDQDNLSTTANHNHSAGEDHLKPFFVLNTFLKVPAQTLDQNVGKENNEQLPLCLSCGRRARQFHEIFEQISRLQVSLNEIRTEFTEKIQLYKDARCQGSGSFSIWERMLRQTLLNSLGGGEEGENDHFSEEWHFGNTVVKSDVAKNEHGSDVEEEAFVLTPTIPLQARPDENEANPSYFLEETAPERTDDDDDWEAESNFAVKSVVTPPSKKLKPSGPHAVAVPHVRGTQSKWLNCADRTNIVKLMNAHVSHAEKSSQGVPSKDFDSYLARDRPTEEIPKSMSEEASPDPASLNWVWRGIAEQDDQNYSDIELDFEPPSLNNTNKQAVGQLQESHPNGNFWEDENEQVEPSSDVVEGEVNVPANPRPNRQKTCGSEVVPILKRRIKGIISRRKGLECPNCPYRTKMKKELEAHLSLHEECSQAIPCEVCGWYVAPEKLTRHRSFFHSSRRSIQKMKKKTKSTQQASVSFKCAHCPHKTNSIMNHKRHQNVHQEGQASACNECGVFVRFNGVVNHRITCASAIRDSLGRDELLSGAGSKGKIRNENYSNPGVISFNRTMSKRKHYQCRQCPYETLRLCRMQVHIELHEEGSQTGFCGDCGWLLPSGQLETHRTVNHSTHELQHKMHVPQESKSQPVEPISSVKKSRFRCAHCPHESKCWKKNERHLALHSNGSTAIPCPDCDIFYRPTGKNKLRHSGCKWKILKNLRKRALIGGRT